MAVGQRSVLDQKLRVYLFSAFIDLKQVISGPPGSTNPPLDNTEPRLYIYNELHQTHSPNPLHTGLDRTGTGAVIGHVPAIDGHVVRILIVSPG